jgi:putative ABC transport system permease protein
MRRIAMHENIATRLRAFMSRLCGVFTARRLDADFQQELEDHLHLLTEENIARGMSREEAARAARMKFGSAAQLRERHYRQRTLPWLESLAQDVRFAFRMLRKNPGFASVAVLTLALGIGANTAIFTLIDAVLLRMLPVEDPGRLVELHIEGNSFSYPAYQQFRDSSSVFSGTFTVSSLYTPLHATTKGQNENAVGQYVSGNYFSVLGVQPVAGRMLLPSDDDASVANPSVAVISYGYWQQKFGADPSAVGKQMEIEGYPFTIVGVAPPEFSGLQVGSPEQFWVPLAAEPIFHTQSWLPRYSYHWLYVVGRLKPGVTREQAQSNSSVIFRRILEQTAPGIGDAHDRQRYLSQTIQALPAGAGLSRLRTQYSKALLILMVLVGLVLLVACASVASLVLARAAARRKELAVRLALGAGRWRLVRHVLTESLLLGALGGAAGLALAYLGSGYVVGFMSNSPIPVVLNVRPDLRVLAFTLLASMLTGILFGLAPALRATQVDAGPDLKDRAGRDGRQHARLGKILVVSQVALSLLLLVGAGLFIGTLRNLRTQDAGFNSDNVLLASVNPGKAGFKGAQLVTFYQRLLEGLRQQPGTVSASLSMVTPVAGGGVELSVSVEGYAPTPGEDRSVYVNRVSPGYFATVRTPVLLGRDFSALDTQASPKVALINETMANYYFHGTSPIGRHLTLGTATGGNDALEIVGVVKDSKYMALREAAHRTIFTDCFQQAAMPGSLDLELRSSRDPIGFVGAVRSAVTSLSSAVPVGDFGTLSEQVDRSITQERLVATLSGFFGALALLLACVGLYGLMSYSVGNRTSEIGIRMALGANRARVLWMILREALLLAALGLLVGVPMALAAARLAASQLSGLLFGLSATSSATLLFACAALVASAALAAFIPARRAARTDPVIAIRSE